MFSPSPPFNGALTFPLPFLKRRATMNQRLRKYASFFYIFVSADLLGIFFPLCLRFCRVPTPAE